MPTRFEYPKGPSDFSSFLVAAGLVALCIGVILVLINVIEVLK